MAGRLLEEAGRTVESVAHQLEFTTGSALRNLIKRRTGLSPHLLRDAGGLQYLIACFAAVCEGRRQAQADAASPHVDRGAMLAIVPIAPITPIARVAEPEPALPRRARRTRRGRSAAVRADVAP